jgi:hypothetical protein
MMSLTIVPCTSVKEVLEALASGKSSSRPLASVCPPRRDGSTMSEARFAIDSSLGRPTDAVSITRDRPARTSRIRG